MFAHLRKTQLASQHCVGSLAGRRLSNVMAANRHNMFFLHIVTINRYISSANIVMDSAFQCSRYLLLSFLSLFQQNKMTKDIASIQYYSLSTAGVFTSSWVSSLFTFFWFSQLFFCISLSSGLAVYQLWAFKRGESTLRPKKDSFGIFGSIWKRESFPEFPLQTELCPKPILRHNTLEWCTIES